jgi:hypothetical protein
MNNLPRHYWHELGVGNDRQNPVSQMLEVGGIELHKFTYLKGQKASGSQYLLAIYNRAYVIYRLSEVAKNLLSIDKDKWLELCSDIWDKANNSESENEQTN